MISSQIKRLSNVNDSHEDQVSKLAESVEGTGSVSNGRLTFEESVMKKEKLMVCLITYSIMRHATEDDLGAKYQFARFNLRDTKALKVKSVRQKLEKIQPNFLYIHLGIHDVHDSTTQVDQSMNNLEEFVSFLTEKLPESKVIVSLPLLNGKEHQYKKIYDLRRKTSQMIYRINDVEEKNGAIDQRLFTNYNHNFTDGPMKQKLRMFNTQGNDYVHLSSRGKMSIVGYLRHTLYKIIRGKSFS